MVDVSIVIVNYNTFDLTRACLESVFEKTSGVTFEIILVDNHSETDPNAFVKLFPDLILVASPSNVGFAKGCNLGIECARGKYVLLLNSDTVLHNNAVLICRDFLQQHPEVAAVSSRLEYPDGRVQHNCQRFPSVGYQLFEFLRLQKFLPKKMGGRILFGYFFDYNSIAFPDWVWGTFYMFEKRKLQFVPKGVLSDDYFMYGEDMQWCKEFRLAGYKIGFEPAARVVHFVGKSGGEGARLSRENRKLFIKKYYGNLKGRIIAWLEKQLTRK